MQSVSSRIWTRVAVSIYNEDIHYTTDTTSWPLLPGLLWHGVVGSDRVQTMSQIELFDI